MGGGRNLWVFQSFGPPHSWRTAADGNKAHFKFKVGYLFNLFFVGNFFSPSSKERKDPSGVKNDNGAFSNILQTVLHIVCFSWKLEEVECENFAL